MSSQRTTILAGCLSALLAGCGGAGTQSPTAAHTSLVPTAVARGVATIQIPPRRHTASARRRPDWVSSATQSIAITAQRASDGYSDSSYMTLTPTSNGCTLLPTGVTLCQVPFNAPPDAGADTDLITVTLIDAPDVNRGRVVGFAAVTQAIVADATNPLNIVVGGVVGTITLGSVTNPTVIAASPATVAIPVSFQDIDNVTIGGVLDAPVSVAISGSAASSFSIIPASQASIADPTTLANSQVAITYAGNATSGQSATVTFTTTSAQTLQLNGGNPVNQTFTINVQ